jgi:ferredoxin
MAHQVTIHDTGEVFRCAEDVHVLAAMEQSHRHGIPVGCRNGGCGACKVRITTGRYQTRKMNRAVLSAAEEADGCALACKTFPRSDIALRVLGRVWQVARTPQSTSFSVGFAWTASIPRPDKET